MAKLTSGTTQSRQTEARLDQHQLIELSVRDSRAFAKALLNPQPVNARLRRTIRRYREATGV